MVVNQPLHKLTAPSQPLNLLGKRLGDIEGHLVSHDVVTGPAQLVRYRFDRHHTVALGLLSLIEAFDPRIVSDGEVGRFDKRPSQILTARILVLPLPFFLPLLDF